MKFDCCIIGGGVAGLAAAHKLVNSGKSVAIIEAKRFGGLVKSLNVDGFTLEQGAATLSANQEFLKLCQELGISEQIIYPQTQNYKQFVVFEDQIHQVPRTPSLLFKSKLFNFWDKLRLTHGVVRKFPKESFAKNLSISEFIEQVFCRSAAQRLAAPVMRGIFGGDIEQLKAQQVLTKVFNGLNAGYSVLDVMRGNVPGGTKRGPICCLKGGNESLCKALFKDLKGKAGILEGQAVRLEKESAEGLFQITMDNGELLSARQVFVATAGSSSAKFLRSLTGEGLDEFERLNYAAIAVFHLAIPKPNHLPESGFGVLFPAGSKANVLGILYNSKIFPHVAAPGADLVTVCFGGLTESETKPADMNFYRDQISGLLQKYLDLENSRLLAEIEWKHAIPQYDDNCAELLNLQQRLTEQYPGLHFIGADVGGVGVPARLERVAEVLKTV